MKWTRSSREGQYVAGPYTVERVVGSTWRALGPGMDPDVNWHTKVLAQDECERAARRRINEQTKHTVEPVVGDYAMAGGQYGQISAVLNGNGKPLYCIKLARGRRKCLHRYEFPLVVR